MKERNLDRKKDELVRKIRVNAALVFAIFLFLLGILFRLAEPNNFLYGYVIMGIGGVFLLIWLAQRRG